MLEYLEFYIIYLELTNSGVRGCMSGGINSN